MGMFKKQLGVFIFILAVFICFFPSLTPVFCSPLKSDESVIFFPTNSHFDHNEKKWIVPVHGWIFEKEKNSIWRSTVIDTLLKSLELTAVPMDNNLFEHRIRMFLVDNERGKELILNINGQKCNMAKSKQNGHFYGRISLSPDQILKSKKVFWVHYNIISSRQNEIKYEGISQLIDHTGISVISDIDDTIKISHATDKKELMAHTFLKKFEAVQGMAAVYGKWENLGAAFHYVSASPWQLYPSLDQFINESGFPKGSFDLRNFRFKDQSFFDLFKKSDSYKIHHIARIISRFPNRKFILVGDSGERDPEIYGRIARENPKNIVHVFIRDISQDENLSDRMTEAFKGISRSHWSLFKDPKKLEGLNIFIKNNN